MTSNIMISNFNFCHQYNYYKHYSETENQYLTSKMIQIMYNAYPYVTKGVIEV